jgi:hypothetical protein
MRLNIYHLCGESGSLQSPKLTKQAGQSIDDVCLALLRDVADQVRNANTNPKLRGVLDPKKQQTLLNNLVSAYNGLFAVRYQSSPERTQKFSKAYDLLAKAVPTLNDPQFTARFNDMRGLLQIQPKMVGESTTPIQDPEEPGWLKFPRVNFQASTYGKYIAQQMGDWVKQKRIPKSVDEETLILGKKEPWDLFRQLAPLLFHNNEAIPTSHELGLPPMEQERPFDQSVLPISITPLNYGGKQHWNVHKQQELPQGIRIQFNPQDHNFWKIRDYVAKGEEPFTDARITPGIIDIYELDPYKLQALSKTLSTMGYGQWVGPLNDLMQQFTGKSYGEIQEERNKKEKGQILPPKQINNGIDRNLGTDGHTQLITAGIPFDEAFQSKLLQEYPNVFNPQRFTGDQIRAQQQGSHFMLTRQSSVEADEPGAGKTPQTIVAADLATKMWGQATGGMHQKVLVFTPPPLVEEHWTTDMSDPQNPKVAKPIQYLGEGEQDNILIARTFANWQNAATSGELNKKKWVVVPYSALGMTADASQLATALSAAVKQKMFAASVADEIQMQKDFGASVDSASRTLKNLDIILSGSMAKGGELNLPHRIALSGTPADNSPADMYSIMRATRHPVIYNDFKVQQYQDGFVKQIMGGDNLDSFKETENNIERGDLALNSLVEWGMSTTPEQRDANLRLFGETFIRRTKQQMRPDMPPKADRLETPVQTQEQWPEAKGPQAKQKQDRAMAIAKIPHTVKAAVEYLSQNPNKKAFIVSYYPEVVDQIAKGINAAIGEGSAASVHGGTDNALRQKVARAFQNNQPLAQGVPFRAACYTLGVGAVGLNFSTAQRIIFNDIDWNPSKNLQAEDRIWRIDMPADQIAERQYIIIPGSRDEEKYKRVMRKERVNSRFHHVLQSVSEAGVQPEMADQFLVEIIDEMMFEFNRDQVAWHQEQQTNLDGLIQQRKEELLQYFTQQRATKRPSRGTKPKTKVLQPAAASMPWYRRLKVSMFPW